MALFAAANWVHIPFEEAKMHRQFGAVTLSVGIGLFGAIQSAASAMGVEVVPIGTRDAAEIEKGIANFARGATDG
jgi:hypothetical protein